MAAKNLSGIPESKIFGGGGDESCPEALRGKHVNGIPVESMGLSVWSFLTTDRTDEGVAAAKVGSGTFVVRSSTVENRMGERRDALENGAEPWEAPDVLREMAAAHVSAGMRPKFISASRVAKEGGLVRGGWKVQLDAKGDPVRTGDLMLAVMPEEKAVQRNKYYQDKAQAQGATSPVERAKAGAPKGVDYSENGRGISLAPVSMGDAAPGDFDADTNTFEA